MMLCGGPAIHLFSATEIERLVCGNPILDFDALRTNARYDGGFSADHRVSIQHMPLAAFAGNPQAHLCSWVFYAAASPLLA